MSKKLILKTAEEIEEIRKSSLLVGKTLAEIAKLIRPGISTLELDKVAHDFIKDHGAFPGFLGYHGFPNSCRSTRYTNEQCPQRWGYCFGGYWSTLEWILG